MREDYSNMKRQPSRSIVSSRSKLSQIDSEVKS